jgi:hypothetical protein
MDPMQRSIAFLSWGRSKDKCMRLVQYLCCLLHGLSSRTGWAKDVVMSKSRKLGMSLALMRKIVRLGVPLELLAAIYRRTKEGGLANSGWMRSLAQFFRVVYLLSDHFLLCFRLGVLQSRPSGWRLPLLKSFSKLVWLAEVLLTLVANAFDTQALALDIQNMQDLNLDKKTPDDQAKYRLATQRFFLLQLDTVRAAGDLPVIMYFMQPSLFSGAFVGLMGTITSAIGCYQCWLLANPS